MKLELERFTYQRMELYEDLNIQKWLYHLRQGFFFSLYHRF